MLVLYSLKLQRKSSVVYTLQDLASSVVEISFLFVQYLLMVHRFNSAWKGKKNARQ